MTHITNYPKQFILLLICTFSFFIAKAESEPNNNSTQADPISLNASQSGALSSTDDKDWFSIQVAADGRLTISDNNSSSLDYYINLYEHDGATLITNKRRYTDGAGGDLSVSLSPGKYYILFDRYSSSANGTYTFTPEFIAVTRSGDAESNDTKPVAQSISLNTSVSANLGNRKTGKYDDQDWFEFTVTKDGRLSIKDTTSSELDYYINLYEADGETRITYLKRFMNNSGGVLSVSLSPGVYYLMFDKYSSDFYTYGEYDFTPEFIEVERPGDTESNDTMAIAQSITLNTSVSANLGNRKTGKYDDQDWFEFTVTKDGRLSIRDTTTSKLDYYINLYEADGETRITYLKRFMNNSGGVLSVSLSPGVYYLMFDKYSSDFYTYGEYYFTPEFVEVERPGDAETNDRMEDAQSISLNTSVSANLGNRKIGKYDDQDWFKFTVTKDGRLSIRDTTTSKLDYYINLYEADGETRITYLKRFMNNSGGVLSVSLSPGVYYLMFDKYSSDFYTYGEYYFTPEFVEVERPGDTESNDTMAVAQSITLNTSVSANLGNRKIGKYDNRDWFKFTVTKDGRLTIRDTTSLTLDYYIYVYEADGETNITYLRRYEDNTGGTVSVSLSPGVYYLMFDKYGSDFYAYGEYHFMPEFIEAELPGDAEPNDFIHQAKTIAMGKTITGNLGHRRIGFYDDIDWWKINIPEDGIFTLQDTNDNTLDYYITLYNAIDTSRVTYIRRYKDGTGATLSARLDAGLYYVQINKYGSDFWTYGSYSLNLALLPKPNADFQITQNISSSAFTNTSNNGESYTWIFDDDNISTEVNPTHAYTQPGEYEVCLIVENEAGKDTACNYVTIFGVQKVVGNMGGNTGDVSIDVYGGGFSPESKVKLSRAGFADLLPDTVVNLKRGVLSTLFNLRGADIGLWDVVVETPGQQPITEPNAYTITKGTQPEPWVEITGRNRALIGRWQTYTINYGNKGNVDASGVPLWIAFSNSQDTEIKFVDFEVVPPPYAVDVLGYEKTLRDSVPIYFDTDSLFGEAFDARVYPLIIPIIPAGQTGQLTIRVKSMENFQIMAWANPPIFKSPMNQQVKDCIFWAQMKAIGDGVISIANEAIPGLGCLNSIVTNYIYNPWAVDKPGDDKPKSIQSHLWTLTSTVINCAGDIPIFKVYSLSVSILQLGAAIIDNSIADKECREAFANKTKRKVNVRTVTSFDPNEKKGPKGFTEENYVLKTPSINYTVYFENKDTAKAPAQEIFIVDSLDTHVFDINIFHFTSVTIADTTVNILPGLTEFSIDIDMRPGMEIITRASGKIDTLSGIATWHFQAFDPTTMDDNENPDLGILLPNNNPPQGEGNVQFSIGLKEEVGNMDIIANKAEITFDFNKPIVTNEHTCIIDVEQPQSALTLGDRLLKSFSNSVPLMIEGFDNGAGVDYYTIFVSIDDSAFVPVLRTSEQQVTFTPKVSGEYKFYSVATDLLGNVEETPATFDAVTNVALATNEILDKKTIETWPNPSTGIVYINMKGYLGEVVVLEVRTLTGQTLLTKQISAVNNGIEIVDLSGFSTGLYVLHIKSELSEQVKKIVLQ